MTPLSPAMLRVLGNLATGRDPSQGFNPRGAARNTPLVLDALRMRGLVSGRQLTRAGVAIARNLPK